MIINGVNLNEKKTVLVSMNKIYGLGLNKSKQLNASLGLSSNFILKKLDKDQLLKLNKSLTSYKQGSRLKREIKNKIDILKEIKTYRGIRHSYFLPVRGQRTHTNAGTQKNKKNKKNKKIKKKKNKKK